MIALLISLVIGILHGLYYIFHFYEMLLMAHGGSEIVYLQTTIIIFMPYMIVFILALVFNALGFFLKQYSFILTAAILYIFAGIVSIKMIPFTCFESVFCLLGLLNFEKESISRIL